MEKKKAFKAIDVGNGTIVVSGYGNVQQMLPVEIHHKADGSITNKPSFCIVMTAPFKQTVCGQISLEMLNAALSDIGYELIKK